MIISISKRTNATRCPPAPPVRPKGIHARQRGCFPGQGRFWRRQGDRQKLWLCLFDPILNSEAGHASELPDIMRQDGQPFGEGLGRDLDIVWANGRTVLFESAANPSGNHCVFAVERQNRKRGQEHRQLLTGFLSPLALFRAIGQLKNGYG